MPLDLLDDIGLFEEKKKSLGLIDDIGLFEPAKISTAPQPEDQSGLPTTMLGELSAPPEERAPLPTGRFLKGVAAGAIGTVGGVAGGVEWLTGSRLAHDLSEKANQWAANLTPEDPQFSDALASGIGSAATFFVPGLGVAKGTNVLANVSLRAAKYFGAAASSTLEAMTEAGAVYANVLRETGDRTKASSAATKTFWANLPLLAVTNKLGVFGETGGPLRRALTAAPLEAIQEAGQEVISSLAEKKPVRPKDVATSAGVGAITGGGMGAISSLAERRASPSRFELPQTEKAKLQQLREMQVAPTVQVGKATLIDDVGLLKKPLPEERVPPPLTPGFSREEEEIVEIASQHLQQLEEKLSGTLLLKPQPLTKAEQEAHAFLKENINKPEELRERYSPETIRETLQRPAEEFQLQPQEAQLGREVDATIGDVIPPVGMAIKPIIAPPSTGKSFSFSDPAIEERFQAAHGIPKESFFSRMKNTFIELKNKSTREYESLPKTGEFSPLRFSLLKLAKGKGIASDRALRVIQGITIDLDKASYDLFRRGAILNDLTDVAGEGKDLPFGFDPRSLAREKGLLDAEIAKNPSIQNAFSKRDRFWTALRNDYKEAMEKIGMDVSNRLSRENYYRHQVLEYAAAMRLSGTGKKLKTPSSRGFLKKRVGSGLDLNTDYMQAEHEVMAQMLHDIEIARTIDLVNREYNIAKKLQAKARETSQLTGEKMDWHDLIPDGYQIWQPREGNVFYLADSIPAALADQLKSGALAEMGITVDDLKRTVAMGGPRREFVVKPEVANTLDHLVHPVIDTVVGKASRKILHGWKVWTLISPRRFAKYNIRNLSGDADHVFVGNPKAFLRTPQAVRELYQTIYGDKAMTPALKAWFERGGMESTLTSQEINELQMFNRFFKQRAELKEIPINAWKRYWTEVKKVTDFREAILRYSNYLEYLKQMEASSDGTPQNFGASIPEEIMALSDIKDRAFMLSNDLLGAYDRVSVMGQAVRRHLIPFWSWTEANFMIYKRLLKNAARDRSYATMIGRKAVGIAARSPFIAFRVGSFLIKAAGLWALLQVWNHTRFPEEEESLPEEERRKPHIILGRDEHGKVLNFMRLGSLGDFLEWFGLDAAPTLVDDWYKGKRSLKEIALEMAQSPVNKLAQGVTPFIKTPAEIATRRAFFPDIFHPTAIRDRGLHIARSLGLEHEYKALADIPSEGYQRSIPLLFIYRSDPYQSAYHDMQARKNKYLEKIGKGTDGFMFSPISDSLYNLKLAIRYQDKTAQDKYFREYLMRGGTPEGLRSSLNGMNPLFGLKADEAIGFLQSLNAEEQRKMLKALKFYEEVLLGGGGDGK